MVDAKDFPTDRGLCCVSRVSPLKYSSIRIFPFLITTTLLICLKKPASHKPFSCLIFTLSYPSVDNPNPSYGAIGLSRTFDTSTTTFRLTWTRRSPAASSDPCRVSAPTLTQHLISSRSRCGPSVNAESPPLRALRTQNH